MIVVVRPTSIVIGHLPTYHYIVSVGPLSLLSMFCPVLPIVRRNEIRDVTASLLTEVCHDVSLEPDLQPRLTGEVIPGATSVKSNGARLDIAVSEFWGGRFERTYLNVGFLTHMLRSTGVQHLQQLQEA